MNYLPTKKIAMVGGRRELAGKSHSALVFYRCTVTSIENWEEFAETTVQEWDSAPVLVISACNLSI